MTTWTDAGRAELDARDSKTRREEHEAAVVARLERDRIDAVWEPIRAALNGYGELVADLVELHRPELVWEEPFVGPRAEGRLVCPGCDSTDGLDPPDWPCATVRLLRDRI